MFVMCAYGTVTFSNENVQSLTRKKYASITNGDSVTLLYESESPRTPEHTLTLPLTGIFGKRIYRAPVYWHADSVDCVYKTLLAQCEPKPVVREPNISFVQCSQCTEDDATTVAESSCESEIESAYSSSEEEDLSSCDSEDGYQSEDVVKK